MAEAVKLEEAASVILGGQGAMRVTIVTCPEIDCWYNGYGECQLGTVPESLISGTVSERFCPYFAPSRPSGQEEPGAAANDSTVSPGDLP